MQTAISSPKFIDEEIFDESLCCTDPKEKVYFKGMMRNKKFRTELCYRGSSHGWMVEDFFRMSDGKGPTICLFKIEDNDNCIGAFTSVKWTSPEEGTDVANIIDPTALLLNLTLKRSFKSRSNDFANCRRHLGPYFGFEELEVYQPFNEYNNGFSRV